MKKSYVAPVLACGLVLAACGGDDDTADAPAASTAPEATSGGATADTSAESPAAETLAATDTQAPLAPDAVVAGGGEFAFTLSADPQNYDPHGPTSANRPTLQVKRFLYDPLVNLSSEDALTRPGLARSWEEVEGGILFHLADGVTCSDGTPLSATDVADNINFAADPDNGYAGLGVVLPMGTSAEGDDAANTMMLYSPVPMTFLLRQLVEFSIACPAGLADHSLMETASYGTGPYVLEELVPGSEIHLTRRDDYAWGPTDDLDTALLPERVTIRIVDNETTAANLLLSGDVQAAAINGGDQERVAAAGFEAQTFSVPVAQLTLNKREGHVLADDATRLAVAQAVDRAQVSAIATAGHSQPSKGNATYPYLCGGVDPESVMLPYDPAAAEAGLVAAGWTKDGDHWTKDGADFPTLVITYAAEKGPAVASGAELLGQNLNAIGIPTELQAVVPAAWVEQRNEGAYDIAMFTFEADTPTHMLGAYAGNLPGDADGVPGGRDWGGVANPLMVEIEADLASSTCESWNAAELWNYESASQIALDNVVVPYFHSTDTSIGVGGIGGQIQPTTIRVLGS